MAPAGGRVAQQAADRQRATQLQADHDTALVAGDEDTARALRDQMADLAAGILGRVGVA